MGSHVDQGTTWVTYREHIRAAIDTLNVFHNSLGSQLAVCREREVAILKQIADLQTELDCVRIEMIMVEHSNVTKGAIRHRGGLNICYRCSCCGAVWQAHD